MTHMMPANSQKNIKSVDINYYKAITGFSFFDKEKALVWRIGDTRLIWKSRSVKLADNEVIVGVVAKIFKGYQSVYTDFQFIIG